MRIVLASSVVMALTVTAAVADRAERVRQRPTPHGNPATTAPAANPLAGARGQSTGRMPDSRQPNTADQTFLIQMAGSGLAKVEKAQLAEQKGGPSVRDFARQMTADHRQMNQGLEGLAEGAGVSLPEQVDAENRQVRDGLGRLSGPEFDIEFMRVQVQAHQRAVQLTEYEIGSGADPQIRRFASDALPRLYVHLDAARELLEKVSMQHPQIAAAPPRKVSGMPTPQTPRASGN